MKLTILEDKKNEDIEIIIKCKEKDAKVENIVRSLKLIDLKIVGYLNDRTYLIHVKDIYYFESVDEKIFCYMKEDVYETKYRLYELETLLSSTFFIRVSRTTILNHLNLY